MQVELRLKEGTVVHHPWLNQVVETINNVRSICENVFGAGIWQHIAKRYAPALDVEVARFIAGCNGLHMTHGASLHRLMRTIDIYASTTYHLESNLLDHIDQFTDLYIENTPSVEYMYNHDYAVWDVRKRAGMWYIIYLGDCRILSR